MKDIIVAATIAVFTLIVTAYLHNAPEEVKPAPITDRKSVV